MIITALVPLPTAKRPFRLAYQKFVPDRAGCYVLTTFNEVVLYVGLTVSLRRRAGEHMEDLSKSAVTPVGRAAWFHWLETDDTAKVERTWMNIHILHEGRIPHLNRAYSPVST